VFVKGIIFRKWCKNDNLMADANILLVAGPDLRGANWAVAQGHPQLKGLHKKQ